MLQAFRTQDGTLLWQISLPDGTFGPSLQNQLVAVMTPDQVVMVFHASDGTLAWKRSLSSANLNLTSYSVYTDLDANGFFLFGNQQTINVWRSSDGRDVWHGAITSRIVWQPQVVNGRLYLWQFDGTLEVVDLQGGSVLWRYPQPPAQTQQCGTISTIDNHDARLAQPVGVCFWKAFQQCNPASLIYIRNDQEVRTFTIKKTSSTCMIQDTVQPGTTTTQRITYTCSDVQAFRGGNGALTFINCESDGSIIVPVNPAIQ